MYDFLRCAYDAASSWCSSFIVAVQPVGSVLIQQCEVSLFISGINLVYCGDSQQ